MYLPKFIKRSFAVKILVLLLGVATIPYLINNFLVLELVKSHIKSETKKTLQAVASIKHKHTIKLFDKQVATVSELSTRPEMYSFSQMSNSGKSNQIINDHLLKFIKTNDFESIFIYNSSFKIIYSTEHDVTKDTNKIYNSYYNPPFMEQLKKVKFDKNVYLSDFYIGFIHPEDPVMYFVAPIIDQKDFSNSKYFLVIGMGAKKINDIMVEDSVFGESGETYLVGDDSFMRSNSMFISDNAILRHKINNSTFDYEEEVNPITNSTSKYGTLIDYRDIEVFSYQEDLGLSKRYYADFDWTVVTEIDRHEALHFSEHLLQLFAYFLAVFIVVTVLLARYYSSMITKPITALTDFSKQLATGNDPKEIRIPSYDEIGTLTKSFRRLQRSIQQITLAAINISKGDYAINLRLRSKDDSLIHALKTMSASLQESDEKQKKLVNELDNHSKDMEQILSCTRPICSINLNYEIEQVNDTFCKLFDVDKSVIGKKCYEVIHVGICENQDCIIKQILRTKGKVTQHIKTNLKNGEVTDCFITGVPMLDEKGDIRGIVENISDITDSVNRQKEIEQRGREISMQNWLKTGQTLLTDNLRGDLNNYDLSSKTINFIVKYIDAQVGAIYTITDSDKSVLQLVSSYAFSHRSHLSNKIKPGEGLVGQAALEKTTIILSDVPDDYIKISSALGETSPTNIIVLPIIFEGKLLGVMEIGALKPFTKLQLDFLEAVRESLGVVYNSCFSREKLQILLDMTQQQAEELQTQQEELRVANEELREQTEELRATGDKLKIQQEELREMNTNLEEKTQYLEEQKAEIEIKNREIMKTKVELEKKAKLLSQASKYKSEFLANMSHELRTPLNSLLILSKDLSENRKKNLTKDQTEAAQIIFNSGNDLLELINDILDLSKVEAGKMQIEKSDVNIEETIDYVYKIFKPQAKTKGLELIKTIEENTPLNILSDQHRVGQILKNLLSNAFKFTSKGHVEIKACSIHDDPFFNDIDVEDGKWVVISVEDTGIGITQEKQEAIFEAFQQADGSTSRKYGGTGLGLSISKELIHLLGGEIYLESNVDKGTIFRIILPLEYTNKTLITDKHRNTSTVKTSKKSSDVALSEDQHIEDDRNIVTSHSNIILSIEDDLNFAKVLKKYCNDQGFSFLHASDGNNGLKLARMYYPKAIILDIMLPGKDGWEILSELKSDNELSKIPVQIMTAKDTDKDSLAFPVLGILNKPVKYSDLLNFFDSVNDIEKKNARAIVLDLHNKSLDEIADMRSKQDIEVIYCDSFYEFESKINIEDFTIALLHIDNVGTYDNLQKMLSKTSKELPQIVVFCDADNLPSADINFKDYKVSIIVKGEKSKERLANEVSMIVKKKKSNEVIENQEDSDDAIEEIKLNHDKDLHLKSKKVLVVDDDMRNIFAVSHFLESKDIVVKTAFNGKAALEALAEDKTIDLVLMDIMMPIMDGETATKKIRQMDKFKDLPIIVLTAKAMKGDKEKFLNAGASDYLAKPLDTEKLLSLLRVWLS
jgi:PAS domain S-box-containing protein